MDYKCEIVQRSAQPTASSRTRTPIDQLSMVMGKVYSQIGAYVPESGAAPAGAPYTAYYNMDIQDLDLEIGFPMRAPVSGKGEIQAGEIPAGRYAACLHVGPYAEIEAGYTALTAWLEENGHEATGIAYEFYLNDPGEVPPEQIETQILFPLKEDSQS
jgi:effector-binding domain-containing protein